MLFLLKSAGFLIALVAVAAYVLYRVDEARTTNTSASTMTVHGSVLVRIVYHSVIAQLFARITSGKLYAITFWNRIYVTSDFLTPANLKHELVHVQQWHAFGRIRFVLEYVFYLLKDGYVQHPFEVAARSIAGQDPWIR